MEAQACSRASGLGDKLGSRGSVKGSMLGLTPGKPLESSHRDEQHGTPPLSGRASASSSAFIAATRLEGGAVLSRAAARSAASRQIGHEQTWRPPTIIPRHWQWCSVALALGTRPSAPDRARIRSAAAARQSRRAGKPWSTSVP